MKRLFFFILLLLCQPLYASPVITPKPPQLAAKGYLLLDVVSNSVLTEKNADQRMEPASLTKIMTTYIAYSEMHNGNLHLEDQVQISEKAWRAPGSRMFVEVNTRVKVEDLLRGIIIQSGNDATIALAEHIAGTEEAFANVMNEYARLLKMDNTHFVNSTGLPHEDHYTTPRDLAKLARALIMNFPDHYSWYAEKEFTYNKINQHNRNRLLWRDKTVDGIKTGHTESAGYCLVASALRNDMRLISVVLGTDSEKARETSSLALLNYGFRFFETSKLFDAGSTLAQPKLWKGQTDTVNLGVQEDVIVTVPRGQTSKLKKRIRHDSYLLAPLKQGQPVGTLEISLGDKNIVTRPIVVLEDTPEGGLWGRLVDTIMLFFIKLFN